MREHWIAVGSITERARKALIDSDCSVLYVSSKPDVTLVCVRYEDKYDLRMGYAAQFYSNCEVLEVPARGLFLFIRSKDEGERGFVGYASVTDVEILTEKDADEEWVAIQKERKADEPLGDLDEHPF